MAVASDDQRVRWALSMVRIVEHAFAVLVAGLVADDVPCADMTEVWAAFDRIERRAANT